MNYTNIILDINNKQMKENLEKELYYAFFKRSPDAFIMNNYIPDGENKIKPCFDYNDLIIPIIINNNNSIICAAGINLNMKNETQLEKIGFSFKEKYNSNVCEILFMFQIKDHNFNPFELGLSQNKFIKEILLQKGINEMYGSCSKYLLKLYKVFKWQILDNIGEEYKLKKILQ
jgi:hypothetical protein